MKNRTTDDNIQALSKDEIFVFGSNESGRHGKGAAKTAMKWGAVYRQAEGLQGRTYGLPTVDSSVRNTLTIPKIKVYVDRFIEFAKANPDLTFLVTEVGCGLAGHSTKKVGPLFEAAKDVENIHLPRKFWRQLT